MKTILMSAIAMTFVASTALAGRTPAETRCAKFENALMELDQKADREFAEGEDTRVKLLDSVGALGQITLDGCEHLKAAKDAIKAKFDAKCKSEIAEQEGKMGRAKADDFKKHYRCEKYFPESTNCKDTDVARAEGALEGYRALQKGKVAVLKAACWGTLNNNP